MQLAMPHPSTKATNGTYRYRNIHERTVAFIYRSTAAISRNAPFLLLQSIAVPQAIKLHPSRGAPKRRRRAVAVAKEHLLCSRYDCSCRQIRFRLISPIPSLLNHRGNDLHTVDVCCKYNLVPVCASRRTSPTSTPRQRATIAMSMLVPFSL